VTSDVAFARSTTDRSVHETAERAAGGSARDSVGGYVGYEEWLGSPMIRREVARCGFALILAFGDRLDVCDRVGGSTRSLGAFVVGPQSHATLTTVSGHQHGVQVELTDAGAVTLLGSVRELKDDVIPIVDVLGSWGARLVERLGNMATWEERFCVLDQVMACPPTGGEWAADAISPEVVWLRRQLAATGGQARVEPLMDETGWSRRVVTERFRAQLGVSPKAYARIVRFRRAVGLLGGMGHGRTLADVAMECGYYDQSHFARDCVALAGCPPSALLAESSGDPGVRFLQDDRPVGSVP
jgi:AraC-like DNA-binding protein